MLQGKLTRTVFSVSKVNQYAKRLLEADALLAGLFVEGELSDFNAHSSGHLYFTLKDATAAISGVMFRGDAATLAFTPKSGMKVIAFGRLSLYEKTGRYQFYAEYLEPAGIGSLQLAFAQLKERLEAEGLFSNERKRKIPQFAKCIAVITSPTGAAVRDIIKIIRERNSSIKIVVSPSLVQGEGAAADICRAICEVNEWGGADVIILGRGGGSAEDLQPFNEEMTARGVAASKIPVISAVGHETDYTITDFVADLRAATPTAAAVTAAFDQAAALEYVRELNASLAAGSAEGFRQKHLCVKSTVDLLSRRISERLIDEWKNLSHQRELLEKVSPYSIFRRGFTIVKDENNNKVSSINTLYLGQKIHLTWPDGVAVAEVKELTHAGKKEATIV
ncbi:MAG: exodeoxyribonuclease VII large subunit [Defluviitaleaceae bacterium]|nr:exodeoxyribonuclease VII large subunit [Defluviitaleaceae bacterium]